MTERERELTEQARAMERGYLAEIEARDRRIAELESELKQRGDELIRAIAAAEHFSRLAELVAQPER